MGRSSREAGRRSDPVWRAAALSESGTASAAAAACSVLNVWASFSSAAQRQAPADWTVCGAGREPTTLTASSNWPAAWTQLAATDSCIVDVHLPQLVHVAWVLFHSLTPSSSPSPLPLRPLQNGLAEAVQKSRKQIKERKNRSKPLRGVKKSGKK